MKASPCSAESGDYAHARTAFIESVGRYRTLGNRPSTADWLLQLALAHTAAQVALAECLAIYRAIGNTEAIADCLVIAAGIAEAQDQGEQAARLLGAAGQILEQFNLLHHGADAWTPS